MAAGRFAGARLLTTNARMTAIAVPLTLAPPSEPGRQRRQLIFAPVTAQAVPAMP